jgi:hypothetical protein
VIWVEAGDGGYRTFGKDADRSREIILQGGSAWQSGSPLSIPKSQVGAYQLCLIQARQSLLRAGQEESAMLFYHAGGIPAVKEKETDPLQGQYQLLKDRYPERLIALQVGETIFSYGVDAQRLRSATDADGKQEEGPFSCSDRDFTRLCDPLVEQGQLIVIWQKENGITRTRGRLPAPRQAKASSQAVRKPASKASAKDAPDPASKTSSIGDVPDPKGGKGKASQPQGQMSLFATG